MKVLVTGATGLLGKAVVRAFHAQGIQTRSLVHATAISRHDEMASTEIVWGDITNVSEHADYVKDCDAVVHCAWNFVRGNDADAYKKANIDPAIALMETAHDMGVNTFITISSVSVYGLEAHENGSPFVEEDRFCSYDDAMDIYPRAKQDCERAMTERAEELGMKLTIIRPGLLYSDDVAPVKKMIKGKVALFAGWGNNHLPYIHVDSVAELIVKIFNDSSTDSTCEIFNAVPAHNDTCRAVFRRWKKEHGSPAKVVYLPDPAFKALALAPFTIKTLLKKNAVRPNVEYQTKTGTRNVDYSATKAREKYDWVGY
jgi:nucleoside-diphosphate-sugar epimerase